MSAAADEPGGSAEPDSSVDGDPAPELTDVAADAERDAVRARVTAMLQAHGDAISGYCVAMVGEDGARALWPTIFGHLEQRFSADMPVSERRLTAYAVAHNRCVQRCRTAKTAGEVGMGPVGLLDPGEIRAIGGLAQLRPLGRDAFVLRMVLGLTWDELARVCGVERPRLMVRVNRAWRRMAHLSDPRAEGPAPMERPPGSPLSDSASQWMAIREAGAELLLLRDKVRSVLARHGQEPGWCAAMWQQLDAQREHQLRTAQARAAEREAEAQARAAAQAEAAAEPRGGSEGVTQPEHDGSVDGGLSSDEESEPRRRSLSWGWIAFGVALGVIGLAARWLATG
ncbi:MAG: hypothetical protein K0V04_34650 [Deltaproteobacteria bacterium]|nr:hypothetical protein [Deltaproteobacteria bacterium]